MIVQTAAVVTDIEGTTTPISFVKDTLFPYARARLKDFLSSHGEDAEVGAAISKAASISGKASATSDEVGGILLQWIDEDRKFEPLKTLQGLIWREGYKDGTLKGAIYSDAAAALRMWAAQGVRLSVYSSGSALAQKLLFGATTAGDLSTLFERFFDTAIGGKKEVDSYKHIARELELEAQRILFLSDIADELDAAAKAGFRTVQVVRPEDGTVPSGRHVHISSFEELQLNIGANA